MIRTLRFQELPINGNSEYLNGNLDEGIALMMQLLMSVIIY